MHLGRLLRPLRARTGVTTVHRRLNSMPAPFRLTPEQLQKQEDRKAAKLAKKAANLANRDVAKEEAEEAERSRFMKRPWVQVAEAVEGSSKTVSIVSWNMLAQTLVRRDLFPGSDCLRWNDRKSMMVAEMRHYDSDIFVLQEVDRLDAFLPLLPAYEAVQTKGPGKQHGLVVLYRSSKYRVKAQKTVYLDDELLRDAFNGETTDDLRKRRAGTRQTRNVGLLVALEDVDGGSGVVLATTHLFWHPKFAYERTRQILLLVNAIYSFQAEHHLTSWPAFLSGDLNTQPSEPTYRLLVCPNDPLPQYMIDDINYSRIVHTSVDKIALDAGVDEHSAEDEEEEAEEEEPDQGENAEEDLPDNHERSIKNTRRGTPADGLLTCDELAQLAQTLLRGRPVVSAYAAGAWETRMDAGKVETFGGRRDVAVEGSEEKPGDKEPAWTCFTPLWRLTLDYVFLLPSRDETAPSLTVQRLLAPPIAADLGPGLPRKGISASDHLLIGAQFAIST